MLVLEERRADRRERLRPSEQHHACADVEWTKGMGPVAVWLCSLWFGCLAGLLEALVQLANVSLFSRVSLASLRTNRHALWMVPATELVFFAGVGVLLALAAGRRARWASWLALAVYGFFAVLPAFLAMRLLHPLACIVLAAGLSARLTSWLAPRLQMFRRVMLRSVPVLGLIVAAWVSCQFHWVWGMEARVAASLPAPIAGAPNVLFIVLDTVRADHLGFGGSVRNTSPFLDGLARRGVRFEQARATAPWTLPSHASMFTGRWHSELDIDAYRSLDESLPTIAELFRDQGYATGAFVGNIFNCNSAYGLDRGFAHYADFPENTRVSVLEALNSTEIGRNLFHHLGLAFELGLDPHAFRKDAAAVNREALAWLSHQQGRPFFMFLNYFDAHDPYLLPDGVKPKFGLDPRPADQETLLREWYRIDRRTLTPHHVAVLRDAYDDGIAYLDDQIARLFAELGRRGVLENTLVVITADHGEELGEHKLFGHAKSLYGEELHVPLLIFGTDRVPVGRTVREPVSLRDLPATLFEMLGVMDRSPFPGRSLARLWDGTQVTADPVLSESFLYPIVSHNMNRPPALRGPMKAVAHGDHVLIVNANGTEELYDIRNDPGEEHDLASFREMQPIVEHHRKALKELLADSLDR
jgi:arylsulfatase A-like enzyme